jgi:pimeloyl-ACP methyl ester carboxylesterase
LRSSINNRYHHDLAAISKFFFSIGIVSFLALAGCNYDIAKDLVKAPNRQSPDRGVDAPAEVLAEYHVSQQLRVNVGPPAASVLVWVVNPIDSHQKKLSLGPDVDGQPVVLLTDQPQNSPSVASFTAPPLPRATVFMLNGLGDRMESPSYEFYSLLIASEGYRVVMLDLRGHGRSTGDHITYGFRESRDLVQILDALQRQGMICGPVGVVGISYGGAMAICWAAIDPRVRAVVALEPFSSLREATRDAGPSLLGADRWMFSGEDLQKVAGIMGRMEGFDPNRDSPLAAIARCKTPVLLIHGKSDTFLRPEHSIRLHEAALDHSRLILVDGANHFDLWLKGLPMIPREINAWFGQYLPAPSYAASPTTRPFASTQPVRLGLSP